jgi:hypothetical protein
MTGKVTRMLLVVVMALTLAVGALGVTSGIGPDGVTPEVSEVAAAGHPGNGQDPNTRY